MSEPDEYKPTFFDRHGPDAANIMMGAVWGGVVFILSFFAIILRLGPSPMGFAAAIIGGGLAGSGGLWFGSAAGAIMRRFTAGGDTTPYIEQYSYQQALVMKGQIDEALESFEAVIAEKPDAPDPRVKAAELYVKERQNHKRAAELFREVQRIATTPAGQYIYVTNRLVDLYTGPLGEPGKALVELRKLIDRYPGSPAALQAKDALAELKARHLGDVSS
jgi:tetratricopeptide (TPR) repeat protein